MKSAVCLIVKPAHRILRLAGEFLGFESDAAWRILPSGRHHCFAAVKSTRIPGRELSAFMTHMQPEHY